jgi:hypothetical protein
MGLVALSQVYTLETAYSVFVSDSFTAFGRPVSCCADSFRIRDSTDFHLVASTEMDMALTALTETAQHKRH